MMLSRPQQRKGYINRLTQAIEITKLLESGLKPKEVAYELGIHVNTVRMSKWTMKAASTIL
jgi:DNA-binding CsgD family transcriptional regulator